MPSSGQAQPASAQSPQDLIKQAVEAQGGGNALSGLKTSVAKIDAKHWEPGQSYSINGESRFLGDSTVTISVDFTAPIRFRYDWERDMKYPAVEKVKYSEIRYPDHGAVINDTGFLLASAAGEMKPMSGIRFAAMVREGARGSRMLLWRAMNNPQKVAAIAARFSKRARTEALRLALLVTRCFPCTGA